MALNNKTALKFSRVKNVRNLDPIEKFKTKKLASSDSGVGVLFFIKDDGTLWGNGTPSNGGSFYRYSNFVQINQDTDWKDIAISNYYSTIYLIKTDGSLWSWGDNTYGQLGIGSTGGGVHPLGRIGADTDWVSVSAGHCYVCAIKSDGTLWSCGYGGYKSLCLPDAIDRYILTKVPNCDGVKQVSCYNHSTAFIKNDGTLWFAGENDFGQFGLGHSGVNEYLCQTGTDTDWDSVSIGWSHSLAIKKNGTLFAAGYNNKGQLGTGDNSQHNLHTQVFNGHICSKIGSSNQSSFVITDTGELWVTGANLNYNLGVGDNTNKDCFVKTVVKNCVDAAITYAMSIAIDNTDSLYGCGASNPLFPTEQNIATFKTKDGWKRDKAIYRKQSTVSPILSIGYREHCRFGDSPTYSFTDSLGSLVINKSTGGQGYGNIVFVMDKQWVIDNDITLQYNMISNNTSGVFKLGAYDGIYDYKSLVDFPDHGNMVLKGSRIFTDVATAGITSDKHKYGLNLKTAYRYVDNEITEDNYEDWDGYYKTINDFTTEYITAIISSGYVTPTYSATLVMTFDNIQFINQSTGQVMWTLDISSITPEVSNTIHDCGRFETNPILKDAYFVYHFNGDFKDSSRNCLDLNYIPEPSGYDFVDGGKDKCFHMKAGSYSALEYGSVIRPDPNFYQSLITYKNTICFWFKVPYPTTVGELPRRISIVSAYEREANQVRTGSIGLYLYLNNGTDYDVEVWANNSLNGFGNTFNQQNYADNEWHFFSYRTDASTGYATIAIDDAVVSIPFISENYASAYWYGIRFDYDYIKRQSEYYIDEYYHFTRVLSDKELNDLKNGYEWRRVKV